MKIMIVFGTRPEAIKMCPLILELRRHKEIDNIVCLTGQHKEMLDQVMDVFGILPDYNMTIMKKNQTLSMITSAILQGMDKIVNKEMPDIILVHGDTTTSFAAGLAAFYHKIPVGHVEAGLRTYDIGKPYPEEFNRQAIDIFTKLYFAPTGRAKQNLLQEGKAENRIYVTGNTVIDALKTTVSSTYQNEHLSWAQGGRLIIVTAHRRENIGKNMNEMFRAIRQIVDDNQDVRVIYPIHKNPRVREIANRYLSNHERIRLIEPLNVVDFHNYIKHSYLILTDSGGIQEEAPAFGIPVLVMRESTERPEGVEAGVLRLVGTSYQKIYKETTRLLRDKEFYMQMSHAVNPYGDGHASERIAEVVIKYLREKE